MRRRAFTLIELIAVVAILGLTAGLIASSISGDTSGRRALAEAVSLDAAARLVARTRASANGASVRLEVAERGLELAAIDADNEVIGRVPAPQGSTFSLLSVGGVVLESVAISGGGRSVDYAILLRFNDGFADRVNVLGLSGATRSRSRPRKASTS